MENTESHRVKVFPNGDVYNGDNFGTVPHGKGKYTWYDGTTYEGDWEEGKMTGKGRISWPSGSIYEGEFSGGYLHGQGALKATDGSTYDGAWRMNTKDGFGKKNYANSDFYEGSWKEGLRQGSGKYMWSSGNAYIGTWKSGMMCGKGLLKWANGDIFYGSWLDGLRDGSGFYRFSDGGCYCGTWSRGIKDGKGTFYPAGSKHVSLKKWFKSAGYHGSLRGELSHSTSLGFEENNKTSGPRINRSASERISSSKSRKSSSRNSSRASFERDFILGDIPTDLSSKDSSCQLNSKSSDDQYDEQEERDVVFEREYMQGVLLRERLRKNDGKSFKVKRSKYNPKKSKSRSCITISSGNQSHYFMLNLQLGIRYTVGKITPIPAREVRYTDFAEQARIKMFFPRKGSQLTPPHYSLDFYWKDYCPMVFRNLREMFKLNAADYMMSICGDDGLREISSPGKSGSLFYLSHDDRFVIKTLRKSELKVFLRMLPSYYSHVQMHENTLITKFFGLHRIKLKCGRKVRFVVMGNMFYTELRIHRRYDLKGSSYGRSTNKETMNQNSTLKDLDLWLMWVQSIAGSSKFPGIRIRSMESHRGNDLIKKSKELARSDVKHWEQITERRYALELVRDAMSTELRVVRQDKYGWVLHAESEWQTHLQQLVHERGIFPTRKTPESGEPEWQLCPIEGPYRMRKKLERCKLKVDTIQNVLDWQFDFGKADLSKERPENALDASDSGSGSFSQLLVDGSQQLSLEGELYDELSVKDSDDVREVSSARAALIDDRASSVNEASLHSAVEFGTRSSAVSGPISDSVLGRSELESAGVSSSMRTDDVRLSEEKSDKELLDNGEYLIRPYLEPLEKIRFRYNCERVVGLDKHDGIFLIGELCLYVIENFYIDGTGCICEKDSEDELSIIDQALGVKKDTTFMDFQSKSTSSWAAAAKTCTGGRAWAYNGGAWGKEKVCASGTLPHPWRMWKLNSVHEILKRDYQLRPVAIEIFSMDGCNDLLVFHKKEREEVFKNLVAMNLPRNSMLDTTISGATKQESNEGSRLFKLMAKSFSKRWQNGEISNFQYLMHLNTLAGRGYSDLTQYPVFPWVLADYESEDLDLTKPSTFRKLDKPMGCQSSEGEEEFRKRYESWDDPEVPKFHYGSHYSSAGIVLFYLVRLPPFSAENQKLQGGQFDHADRLFNSIRDTWGSAAGKGNTSDVKELIPEFFYMPEFIENRFNLDLGEKQSGEKVGDVVLPPWAKGSAREFIKRHREALECDYVSENLHHWIDLIFGHKQRGKAAEDAANVFYHYTYEGSVDIDSVTDPSMKASILAQINHFGQTPKQLFQKPHVKRKVDRKPPHPLKYSVNLVPHDVRKTSSSISQIVTINDKILVAGANHVLKPQTYAKYVAWGFPDRSLRFMSYDQDKLLSTHENLHGGSQIQCVGVTHDGQTVVTGADDGLVSVWRIQKDSPRRLRRLQLEKALCAHSAKVSCLNVSQPYMLVVSGSDDCTVILWDLSSLAFVRQLPEFPSPVSAVYVNDLTGDIITAAGVLLAIWSINGDCLAVINTSQLPSDFILSVASSMSSDWQDINWYVTGHQSGAVKVWKMVHYTNKESAQLKPTANGTAGLALAKVPEYRLILHKVLKSHKHPVTALHLTTDLKQLLSGDSAGHLLSWTLPGDSLRGSSSHG